VTIETKLKPLTPESQYLRIEDNSEASTFTEMDQNEFEDIFEGRKHTEQWGESDTEKEESLVVETTQVEDKPKSKFRKERIKNE